MADYQIRLYQPGDETAINDGFNEIFNQNRSLETWRWKFRAAENKHLIMVALNAAGELVSHYGFILEDVMIDGERRLAGQVADLYRLNRDDTGHQMIFLETAKQVVALIEDQQLFTLGYGFPGVRSMRIGLLRLKYSEPMDLTYLARRWQPSALPRLTPYVVNFAHDVKTIDDLWSRSVWRYPVAIVRDGARIRRRFDQHPSNRYMHLSVWKGNTIHAWGAVTQNGKVAQWIDLLWDGQDPDALRVLERAVFDVARQFGLTKLEMWLNGDAEVKAILEDAGWQEQPNPLELKLTGRILARDFKPIDQVLPRLYITMSDVDLV